MHGFDLSVVLPLHVKAETFTAFLTQYAALPLPPMLAAYLVSYAEFILPICLRARLRHPLCRVRAADHDRDDPALRHAAALWSVHIYWAAILLVLLSLGAGQISVDAIVRAVARRSQSERGPL